MKLEFNPSDGLITITINEVSFDDRVKRQVTYLLAERLIDRITDKPGFRSYFTVEID